MNRTICGLAILLACAAAAAQQPSGPKDPKKKKEKRPLNVDVRLGWGGCYRPLEWTPLDVSIYKAPVEEPVQAELTIRTRQDSMTDLSITRQFVLHPQRDHHEPMVTKLVFGAESCHWALRALSGPNEGRLLAAKKVEFWAPSMRGDAVAVSRQQLLIGMVGRRENSFGLLQLPARSVCNSPHGSGTVFVKHKQYEQVPVDWTAYAGLDLLVAYDVRWDQMGPLRAEAIARWVWGGGKLLLVMGAQPIPDGSPIAKLIPFKIGPAGPLPVTPGIVDSWGCQGAAERRVLGWSLGGAAGTRWRTLRMEQFEFRRGGFAPARRGAEGQVVAAWGRSGFGHVGVLGFDPSVVGGRQGENVAPFWVACTRLLLGDGSKQGTLAHASNPDPDGQGNDDSQYQLGMASQGTNAVLQHLLAIPELRPISIWVVIGLLAALAILIGPVDYLVLKRLDRLPLTWVTTGVWIVVFSAGAYYGVQWIRGSVMRVRVVTVTDGVDGTPGVWNTRFTGIFAPASARYALTRDRLPPQEWWASISPTEDDSLWRYRTRESADRSVYCVQQDGANVPWGLPINIWSMQCLLSEGQDRRLPFTVQLERQRDRYTLQVSNASRVAIAGGYVRLPNNRLLQLPGPVAAGQTRRFSLSPRATGDWSRTDNPVTLPMSAGEAAAPGVSRFFSIEKAFFATGTLRRSRAIEDYLQQGAAAVCVWYFGAPVPFGIEGRRCDYHHIQLARLVVFPGEGSF